MSELRDLYQELILDHNRNPRNQRAIESADHRAEGYNPLCGDRVTVYLNTDGETIDDVSFEGSGCAISTASASLLTEALRGKTREEALEIFERFQELVTGEPSEDIDFSLGKLAAFSGVCEFPARVKCATLVWHTLRSALEEGVASDDDAEPVSTE